MAVFPERIVLKNSTDSDATIITAIESGGTDEIQQGELVIGRGNGAAKLFTVDAAGNIVELSGSKNVIIVAASAPTLREDGSALVEGDQWFDSVNSSLHIRYQSAWVEVSGGGGGGATELDDLTDVQTKGPGSAAFYTGFELDDIMPTYSGGASRSSTVPAVAGTYFLAEGSSSYADFYFDDAFVRADNRYDLYSMWIQPRQIPSTNYRMALGGLAQMDTNFGAGFAIYTRDTGFGIYADGDFIEVGTRPAMAEDVWHHFAVQIDWGVGNTNRTSPPDFISIWVNGQLCLNSYSWGLAYTAPTGAALYRWAFLDSTGIGWSKFYDEMRIAQTDVPLLTMGQASFVIADLETAIDNSEPGSGPTNGQILIYDAAQQLWVPGTGGGGATTLGDLTDVDLTTTAPQNGDALIYDSVNSEWVPGSVSGAVTKIIAGTNVTISPTGGTGDVTINAIGGGGGSATLGRGDGGDIDGTAVDSAFVFGVWGGGDLDTTTEDKPVELVVIGMVDGGDIT